MKYFVIIILLISSISKLFVLEFTEFSIVESDILSWVSALFFSRTLVILEFVLALSLLFKSIPIRLIAIAILLLNITYLLNALYKPENGIFNDYFTLSLFNKWAVLAGILFLVIFSILSLKKNTILAFTRGKRILINLCFALIIGAPLFILNPIYVDFFRQNKTSIELPNLNWKNILTSCSEKGISIEKDTEIFFAFYSTSCYYCNHSAVQFGVSGRIENPSTPIVLVFPGNKEDTEAFIKRNNCDFPYIRISKEEFRALAGNAFPAFFRVKNGKETHYYSGKTFNYRELDNLFN